MARFFRTVWQFLGPARFVSEGDSDLVGYSLGLVADAFAERARQGLLARFPETAPPDALPLHGRDRRVTRGRNESVDSYVRRLLRWLDDRRTWGNAYSLMDQLAVYLGPLPKIRVVDARGNWYTREPDGTKSYLLNQGNWNWEPAMPTRWSRFWVIIYPNGLWAEGGGWGDSDAPAWGDNAVTWGSTATADEVQSVRRITKEWKRAGTRCVNVIVAFDPASFDPASPEPDGTWGVGHKIDGGVAVASRLSTARYWDGTS
jgi:hypothetical protein